MSKIEPGGHLCLFYERDPAEQMPALIPFITEGLSRDEQFIYIADDLTVDELAGHLARNGIDVAKESDTGRLLSILSLSPLSLAESFASTAAAGWRLTLCSPLYIPIPKRSSAKLFTRTHFS